MSNAAGKRYECGKCGAQVIVTKAGAGTLTCHGESMVQK